MKKILFLCTGNTCRSPMAEALFNSFAIEHNLDMAAESAGISAFCGDEINPNSAAALGELGIDMSAHRARRFDMYMAEAFDLIVTMTPQQKAFIEAMGIAPQRTMSLDVEDPYGGGIELYRSTRDEIKEKMSGVIERLKENES